MDGIDDEAAPEEIVEFWSSLLISEDLSSRDRLACLINLANALADLADIERRPSLADEAVKYGLLALHHPPPDQELLLTILSDLSAIYLTKFELQGNRDDLTESLTYIQSTVSQTLIEGNTKCSRLVNLCNTLCALFETFGGRQNIEEAIRTGHKAVATNNVQPDLRAKAFGNLARAIGLRGSAYFVQSDSTYAIQLLRQAVDTAENTEVKSICQANFVGQTLGNFERYCTDEMVDESLDIARLALPHLDPVHQAMCLHNMSYLLRLQYEQGDHPGAPQTLQQAVDYAVEAINTHPGNDWQLAMFEDQLALCLEQAFLGGDHDALPQAIEIARNAVNRCGQTNGFHAPYKNHLAMLLKRRCQPEDLNEAINLGRAVLDNVTAAPMDKIEASNTNGTIFAHLQEWRAAYLSFEEGVSLTSRIVKDALNRRDQQYVIGQLSGLSQKAASCALLAGVRPEEAFEVLENGRAILTRLAILERSGLPIDLEKHESVRHLVPRYKELRAHLQQGETSTRSGVDSSSARTESAVYTIRTNLQQELDSLEDQIKQLAAWQEQQILEPGLIDDLGLDYVVAFNVTTVSADALIMDRTRTERLSLSKLLPQEMTSYVNYLVSDDKITSYNLASYRAANKKMLRLLQWLWDVAVCPVLDHLGLRVDNITEAQLPRICWIAAGPLGLLPIHAAGCHTPGSKEFLMRYAYSSYAVSLQSLAWHRRRLSRRLKTIDLTQVEVAVYTMATTPGWPTLKVEAEEKIMLECFPLSHVERQPTVDLVRQELTDLSIVHFACHGISDASDPSESHLILRNSHDASGVARFSVYELATLETSHAWLAFLSACTTADLQSIDHVDENIHIAGGFQIAGFSQIVGTLWLAENDVASSVAVAFYKRLSVCTSLTCDSAVHALHESIKAVREILPQAVLSWAPFVLYGA